MAINNELLAAVRRENLRTLADEWGGIRRLADALERNETQLSHLIGKNAGKPIGEKLARYVETRTNKPNGWLDKVHGINDELYRDVRDQVDAALREAKRTISRERRDELIALCYKLYAQHDGNRALVRQIIGLTGKG